LQKLLKKKGNQISLCREGGKKEGNKKKKTLRGRNNWLKIDYNLIKNKFGGGGEPDSA